MATYPQRQAERTAWWLEQQPRLEELVAQGQTCNQIAAALGVTKNAVAGQIWRKDLRPLPPSPEPLSVKQNLFPPIGRCVFPHGEPSRSGFHFCGAPTGAPEQPWCPVHRQVVFVPASAMRSLEALQ